MMSRVTTPMLSARQCAREGLEHGRRQGIGGRQNQIEVARAEGELPSFERWYPKQRPRAKRPLATERRQIACLSCRAEQPVVRRVAPAVEEAVRFAHLLLVQSLKVVRRSF